MKITLRQRCRRSHPFLPDIPRSITLHNRRKWLESVAFLGPNWVVLKQLKKGSK